MPVSASDASSYFDAAGYRMLAITSRHCVALERLLALHSDPFDRMLVAQAITEPLQILTRDGRVAAYGRAVTHV